MKESILQDRIYGSFNVASPIIYDLINTPQLQRLKGIGQFGVPNEFYQKINYTRYEHSTGVMLLLKKLGASQEQQVAGLLHDVSHTAFSHMYDWVIENYTKPGNNETHQDERHESVICQEETATILKDYKYDPKYIANHHNFPLLEQEIPALCADRIDYSLREFPDETSQEVLKNLGVYDNQIICRNEASALLFAESFLQLQTNHWGSYETVARYHLFASILRRCVEIDEVSLEDFLKDDEFILSKVKKSKDPRVLSNIDLLTKPQLPLLNQKLIVYKKFRYIDPKFLDQGRVSTLSETDLSFKTLLNQKFEENRNGVKL